MLFYGNFREVENYGPNVSFFISWFMIGTGEFPWLSLWNPMLILNWFPSFCWQLSFTFAYIAVASGALLKKHKIELLVPLLIGMLQELLQATRSTATYDVLDLAALVFGWLFAVSLFYLLKLLV